MKNLILVLNRRDKNVFSVGEGKLTGKIVHLYKPVQVSTSGLLCVSCRGFDNDLWGGSLFCNHKVMCQSRAQIYGKVQQTGLLLIL